MLRADRAQRPQAARAHGRHAAVCGGLASEPLAAPLLIGLGVHELSAVPAVIPQLKARARARVTLEACRALAAQALRAEDSAAAVRALLARRSRRRGRTHEGPAPAACRRSAAR